jgi:hypothetical protein
MTSLNDINCLWALLSLHIPSYREQQLYIPSRGITVFDSAIPRLGQASHESANKSALLNVFDVFELPMEEKTLKEIAGSYQKNRISI